MVAVGYIRINGDTLKGINFTPYVEGKVPKWDQFVDKAGRLRVWLKNGRCFTFSAVPLTVVEEFLLSKSPDQFFSERIMAHFKYQDLTV